MKKMRRHLLLLATCLLLIGAAPISIEAATPASKKLNGQGTNTSYDITGDGKKDKIQFVHQRGVASYGKMTIKVNGKAAFTKKSNWNYHKMYVIISL